MPSEITPEVEQELREMVATYMDRCDRAGLGWDDFYSAVQAERKIPPVCSSQDLFARAFAKAVQRVSS